ncbi:hypothetical protein DL95DRAFT_125379 [Leptodontidium sp. 2 PMI_412]|nr:hypothetical protein DL95DRAFT_125379 [Leptodontidium sp. 2 PMI_412]
MRKSERPDVRDERSLFNGTMERLALSSSRWGCAGNTISGLSLVKESPALDLFWDFPCVLLCFPLFAIRFSLSVR